jgi:hypothetical protein
MKNDLACTQQRIQRGTNDCARLTSVAHTPTGIFKLRLASRLVLGSTVSTAVTTCPGSENVQYSTERSQPAGERCSISR